MSTTTQTTTDGLTAEQQATLSHFTEFQDSNGEFCPIETYFAMEQLSPRYLMELCWNLPAEIAQPFVTRFTATAWASVEQPLRHFDTDDWIRVFELAGYTVDGMPANRPRRAVRLYRGCTEDAVYGMSWTSDLKVAQWFASGKSHYREPGKVYTALVPARDFLARINDREEAEYVIYPEWQDITEYDPEATY